MNSHQKFAIVVLVIGLLTLIVIQDADKTILGMIVVGLLSFLTGTLTNGSDSGKPPVKRKPRQKGG